MRKFIALLLIFSLVMLSINLYSKERRGVKVMVAKKNGQLIEGELITVKPNSLLILDTEGKDVSVDIADITMIENKSKIGKGAQYGAIIGACCGALIFGIGYSNLDVGVGVGILYGTIIGLPIGAFIGAIIGGIASIGSKEKKYQIEGMTDSEIQETLEKLRKKARIRDYK